MATTSKKNSIKKSNMKSNMKTQIQSEVTVSGAMTFGQLDSGLHIADFQASEQARVEAFTGQCKVQAMRDGNVYITQLPKRIRNRALLREDNMSLSHGRDHRFYVYFSLPEEELEALPKKLVTQAINLADKVRVALLDSNKKGGMKA